MKKIIEESGMTLKKFAEFYEIPYNTVRQWYNEERCAPAWVKKLIEKAANGKQLKMENIVYYSKIVFDDGVVEYTFDSASEREQTKRTYENNYRYIRCEYKDLIDINA